MLCHGSSVELTMGMCWLPSMVPTIFGSIDLGGVCGTSKQEGHQGVIHSGRRRVIIWWMMEGKCKESRRGPLMEAIGMVGASTFARWERLTYSDKAC